MEVTNSVTTSTEYVPTTTQLERAAALKRFNRLVVYLPIIVAALIVLIVVGLLFWVALIQPGEASRETVGGIADAVIILVSIPMMLLCAIPSILFIAITIQGRKKGMAPLKRVQVLFWRLDNIVLRIQSTIQRTMPKIAAPVISGHALVAYVRNLLTQLVNLLKRS